MRDLTSDDFTLIENGPVWTLDDLIARAKQGEKNGATLSYEFAEMETTVNESTAWMTYKNHGVMTMSGKENEYNWTESAVLQKMEDGWKIVLLHSTMNDPGSSHNED
jgi:ketosteroid isomerase-like protein